MNPKSYRLIYVNHEEVMYRKAWLVSEEGPIPELLDMLPILGVIAVTDKERIAEIEADIKLKGFFEFAG